MKGIILAGGKGTRLYPLTHPISKHILPVFDKPMLYYPLSVLMLAGIREILIIGMSRDVPLYKTLLGDGSHLGLSISYAVQDQPNGIAEAFVIGASFIGTDSVALILGDNILYGDSLGTLLEDTRVMTKGALVFGYYVKDPHEYGVLALDAHGNVMDIQEKPKIPASNYVIPGLYFYDNTVVEIAKSLKPSSRGELEITDVNREYLKRKILHVEFLGRGMAWLDMGTHENLLEAGNFIRTIEHRQGLKIACIEEIAYNKKYISRDALTALAQNYAHNQYGEYLVHIAQHT